MAELQGRIERKREERDVKAAEETLRELFQQAVDLRPPDPRTGIW